jgi:hypothetical protein
MTARQVMTAACGIVLINATALTQEQMLALYQAMGPR